MKKKAVIAVVVIAVLVATMFVVHYVNSQTKIPSKELVYMQLTTKGEAFVLPQLKGCTKEDLVKKWGNPDGMLSGFHGDVWKITESASIVVYYSDEFTVDDIMLKRIENNN